MAGLFGLSWTEIIDYLIRLAPAASIVGVFWQRECSSGTIDSSMQRR